MEKTKVTVNPNNLVKDAIVRSVMDAVTVSAIKAIGEFLIDVGTKLKSINIEEQKELSNK